MKGVGVLELNIGQGRRIGQVQTIINRDIYSTLHLIIRISLTRFGHFHKQRLISQTHLPRRNASYYISQTPSINLFKPSSHCKFHSKTLDKCSHLFSHWCIRIYKYCHDNDAYCDLIDSNRPLITCENAHSTTLFNWHPFTCTVPWLQCRPPVQHMLAAC